MDSKRPNNPIECVSGVMSEQPNDGDYYIQISGQALLTKYSGRRKGMTVKLTSDQSASLELLRKNFGAGFGLNEVICYAYHLGTVEGAHFPEVSGAITEEETIEVSFKPNKDSLYAILKVGASNALEDLVDFGLAKLRARF